MIEIRQLDRIDRLEFARIVAGYVTDCKYEALNSESEQEMQITLRLISFDEPFEKKYPPVDEAAFARLQSALEYELSFGAYEGEALIGFLIGEPSTWNRSLNVLEYHVTPAHRHQGIGRKLMEATRLQAKLAGFRTIVCETQNVNVPAIRAYRKLGFKMEGVDLSLYSNFDYNVGEIAIFMKLRLE